ncbi:MAG: TetR/AcrR family transcriptional regulator [Aeromicrobium sp.]|uniref:TetR/AcrR family transcriptional regulator n=1 Tax=Aeromicrobium sp. TaxID=1871063 RepID=UPI0039E269AD
MSTPIPPARVPQEERTRAMRQRLMEATVECLVEYGWTGTTTTVVSKRAGVSRGAQLHHFPTKSDLVMAALDHLSERRHTEIAASAARLPPERGRTRAALNLIADLYVSPVFFAALELWVAARTDPVLREAVAPLERRFGRDAHRYTVSLLDIDESRGRNRQLVQATLDLTRGLALAASLSDDSARRAMILDAWAITLDHELDKDPR